MNNPVLDVIQAEVSASAYALPLVVSLSLPAEQWEELWKRGILDSETMKPFVRRCSRLHFKMGGFDVYVSEEELVVTKSPYSSVH